MRARRNRWLAALASVALVTGCGGADTGETADTASESQSTTTTSAPPEDGSSIPEEPSTLPNGVYRVEVTVDEVAVAGMSNAGGQSGTWSLTVEDGIFELRCATLEQPGKDCGNVDSDGTDVFEAGYLRGGDGPAVYLVADGEVMAERAGCQLPPSTQPGHCFVLEPYWFDWSLEGDQLTMSNAGGVGAHTFLVEPLTKIS